jgi:SNF2 family DNA or RNA helicase
VHHASIHSRSDNDQAVFLKTYLTSFRFDF